MEKFPPFGFTFEFHLFGGANKVTRKKKTLSGSKGKGRVTTPLRPSGAGRAASAPPNGGRGADPNAPTTAKNRVKTPHDFTALKTGAQFQRQMMSIGMCRIRHHDITQNHCVQSCASPHSCDRGRISDITSMSQQVSCTLPESAMKLISFLGFKRNTERPHKSQQLLLSTSGKVMRHDK